MLSSEVTHPAHEQREKLLHSDTDVIPGYERDIVGKSSVTNVRSQDLRDTS